MKRNLCGMAVRLTVPARTVDDMLAGTDVVDASLAWTCPGRYLRSGQPSADLLAVARALGIEQQISCICEVWMTQLVQASPVGAHYRRSSFLESV